MKRVETTSLMKYLENKYSDILWPWRSREVTWKITNYKRSWCKWLLLSKGIGGTGSTLYNPRSTERFVQITRCLSVCRKSRRGNRQVAASTAAWDGRERASERSKSVRETPLDQRPPAALRCTAARCHIDRYRDGDIGQTASASSWSQMRRRRRRRSGRQ